MTLATVPLVVQSDGRYGIDWPGLEAAVAPDTRILLFCNPHNPVGRVFSRAEVQKVAEFCAAHDLVLCSDEIHCDLILDESRTPHVSALTLDGSLRARSITLMAASKTYNVAGLACSFAVIPDEVLRKRFVRAGGKRIAEVSPLSFAATEAAYREGEAWRLQLLEYLRGNRDLIVAQLQHQASDLVLAPLEATYLAWLDVRGLGLADAMSFFIEHGVGLDDGRRYGAEGYLRLNFGCPRSRLAEALQRISRAVAAARPAWA